MVLMALGKKEEANKAYGNVIDDVYKELKNDSVKALDNATQADPDNAMAWKVKGV